MQKSKLSILAVLAAPVLFSTAAVAANMTDTSVVNLEIDSPKIFDEVTTISSGEIDTDLIDLVLNGEGGDGDGGGN